MPTSPTHTVFFLSFFFKVDESVVKKKKTRDESDVGDVDREEKCQGRERLKERGRIKEGKGMEEGGGVGRGRGWDGCCYCV